MNWLVSIMQLHFMHMPARHPGDEGRAVKDWMIEAEVVCRILNQYWRNSYSLAQHPHQLLLVSYMFAGRKPTWLAASPELRVMQGSEYPVSISDCTLHQYCEILSKHMVPAGDWMVWSHDGSSYWVMTITARHQSHDCSLLVNCFCLYFL